MSDHTTLDEFGRPTEVFTISALVDEANRRLRARDAEVELLTERTVRHYISRGLMQKGYTRTQLADEATIHSDDGGHSGNTRYFIIDDIDAAVGIKLKLAQGRTLDEIGDAGRDRSQALRQFSLSPDAVIEADLLGRRSDLVDMMVTSETMFSAHPSPKDLSPKSLAPLRRSGGDVEPEISPDGLPLPEIRDSWTLVLRPGLTLHGEGARPSSAAVRRLAKLADEAIPRTEVTRSASSGRVSIDIELQDIVAPFNGIVVNASNAEIRPGGGVAGRIWQVCGDDEMNAERERLRKAIPLRPGDAVFTGPGRGAELGFTGIIHALGPRWLSGFDRKRADAGRRQLSEHGEEDALIRTWRSVLRVADEHRATQIVAPMISSGIFGYPVPDNFEIAFHTMYTTPTNVERIVIRTISRKTFEQLKASRRKMREILNIA